MEKDLVCVAVISTAHGVHGALKVRSFMESPDDLCALKQFYTQDGRVFKVKSMKVHKGDVVIASFEDIKDRNQSELLRGLELYVPREILPLLEDEEGIFYHTDLIGLNVHLTTGKKIGTVRAVLNYGAGDILEIELKGGDLVCVAFRHETVPTINLEGGFLIIDEEISLTSDDLKKVLGLWDNKAGKLKS